MAEYIEKAESRSLGRGVMLAYCRYYLQDAAGFQDALRYIETMMDLIPEEKKHEYTIWILSYIKAYSEY